MAIFEYDSKDRKKIRARTRAFNADYRLDLGEPAAPAFSFLAVGDTGDGEDEGHPQFVLAAAMADEPETDLVLHLGDVVYLSGSKEGYRERFIRPYRRFLSHGTDHRYDDMVFTKPFLPVYGNHDYYDFHGLVPVLGSLAGRVVSRLGSGSGNGEVFEKAFVERRPGRLVNGRLPYDVAAGRTRIPNRYYWFTYGPCAFFALDTNTLEGRREAHSDDRNRLRLERELAKDRCDYYEDLIRTYRHAVRDGWIDPAEIEEDVRTITDDLVEALKDRQTIEDVLDADERNHDDAQLAWLERVLADPAVEGRFKIVYMHHPLYTSEKRHTDDPELPGLRANLRRRLIEGGVHLVLSGHSHCFEWTSRRVDPGAVPEAIALAEAERRICYLVSGGGGRGLERSILEGGPVDHQDELRFRSRTRKRLQFLTVAESNAYAALGPVDPREDEVPSVHHYLRIDVAEDRLDVRPVGFECRAGRVERLQRFPVLRLGRRPVETAVLERITVTRDGPPQGVF